MSCPAHIVEFDSSTPPISRRKVPAGLNGKLMDRILRHRHFLLRAENGVVGDVVVPLRAAREEVLSQLTRLAEQGGALSDLQQLQRSRFEEMERRITTVLRNAETDTTLAMQRGLEGVTEKEITAQNNILRREIPDPIPLDLAGPDTERVRRLVNQPLGGKEWGERMRENFGDMERFMRRDLATSQALGEGMDAAARRLRGTVGKLGINRATMIARTEIQRVANQAAVESYRQNRDVLKGQQWVATLDSRTCPICAQLDSRVFEPGATSTMPPAHVACRCMLSPVTKSFEELGLNAEEFRPSTRAAMDGQVPDTLSYPEWFADQPEAFQRDVLGPGRFERFKSGDVDFDSMATDQRVLSLDELPMVA